METQFRTIEVQPDVQESVISFSSSMFKLSEFMSFVKKAMRQKGLPELRHQLSSRGGIPDGDPWFEQGIECEFLKPHQNWKKGKIRIKISLEFCPDEVEEESSAKEIESQKPASLLDEYRQQ